MVQRKVLMLQLTFYGLETLDHDTLPHLITFLTFFSIVTTGSNKMTFPFVRLSIAYNQYCEHIDILWIKSFQCSEVYCLLRSSSLSHITNRCITTTSMLKEECFQPIKLPVATFAFWIINSSHKVCLCSRDNAFLKESSNQKER